MQQQWQDLLQRRNRSAEDLRHADRNFDQPVVAGQCRLPVGGSGLEPRWTHGRREVQPVCQHADSQAVHQQRLGRLGQPGPVHVVEQGDGYGRHRLQLGWSKGSDRFSTERQGRLHPEQRGSGRRHCAAPARRGQRRHQRLLRQHRPAVRFRRSPGGCADSQCAVGLWLQRHHRTGELLRSGRIGNLHGQAAEGHQWCVCQRELEWSGNV
ncbi:hypothetical protein SDC9_99019 [bioreactor metagenome]|uniref:Uncharacterized protein n=1 Tax=bioreactor metagenome TaxID=1076179 RepID=A0A645AGC3_9ZZZZ